MIDNSAKSWQSRAKPRYSVKAQGPTHSLTSGEPESKMLNACEKRVNRCEVDPQDEFGQTYKLSTDFSLVHYQTHRQAVDILLQQTKALRMTSVMKQSSTVLSNNKIVMNAINIIVDNGGMLLQGSLIHGQ